MRELQDRVALVTGAGSGIGRALAIELAERGCHVAVTDRAAEPLEPVLAAIEARGRRASAHVFDVSSREAWPDAVAEVLDAHEGRVHVVVNNAGVSLTGPFARCSLEDLEWQLDVNVRGVLYGCHHLLPILLEQDEAHLVNISSLFGIISVPDSAAYCMSKHAVKALSESLQLELWDSQVSVTSVHPGAVATNIVVDGRFREGGFTHEKRARKMIASGIAPEEAARIIADGMVRRQRKVLVGPDARLISMIQRLVPRHQHVIRWWLGRQSRP
jgi:NADP-dependent 3-hydroxy acid dehydrogenase YdfG